MITKLRYSRNADRASINEISSNVSTLPSLGACNTITVDPIMANEQPILEKMLRFSFRYLWANRELTSTLKAPNGVTNDAGANA